MNNVAVLFPGQGSQYVGMGLAFYEKYPTAKKYFNQADEVLTFPLSKLIFEGPEDNLRITTNTQPAILVTSLAIWNVLKEVTGIQPKYVAGHSLGEYSALAAVNSLSFEDAVQIVRKRGQFMEEAVPNGLGAMAAVLGMERMDLEEVCQIISDQGNSVQLANINAPNQIVISGTVMGVQEAGNLAKEKGAKRVIPLPVSGPFHSRLMEPARVRLEKVISNSIFHDASVPVVLNVTAQGESSASTIKQRLIEQVVSPVLWTDSIKWMLEKGIDTFIEVGPGNVLTGLVKKMNKNVKTYSIDGIDALDKFVEEQIALKGGN